MRQRSLSSIVLDPFNKKSSGQVASESFITSNASGIYKGQIVGSQSKNKVEGEVDTDLTYLNHDDINRRAIQIFFTEGNPEVAGLVGSSSSGRSIIQLLQRIIHPYDPFRRAFDLATVLWVLLLVFFIPFDIGFVWYQTPSAQRLFFVLLDFWFAIDIILNFRTGYIKYGTIVMDPKKIASNYLSTWFLIDVLGTVPFEQLLSGQISERKSLKLVKYFKIPKLLRVSRVMKYVRNHKHVYDFSKVLLVIFTMLHVGACLWVMILDPCDDTNESNSNHAGDDVCSQDNVYRIYSEALHLSATMLLGVSNFHIVGKPELINLDFKGRPEDSMTIYLLSTGYMIVGLFLIALLISEANVYVMARMQGSAAFQQKTDRVNHEMEYYRVPPDLQRQVKAYYDYVWIHQRQYDEKIALLSDEAMSTDLQRKLALHLFKDVLESISFFSEIDDLLLGQICLSLRTRIFLPGDMILFKGDIGKELFIISKGVVEVLRDDLPPQKRRNARKILLKNGSFFGEIALVMEVRRTCSVQARTVCEVNILQQDAFDAVVRENPHFGRRLTELVVARQLDSRLAQSQQKGVEFHVKQSDLDLAVQAMEQNMLEGLERRNNNPLSSIDSSHRSNLRSESNKVFSPMRVSFEHVPTDDDGPPDEESQSAKQQPISDVLQDIARRSTRFPDEFDKKTTTDQRQTLSEQQQIPEVDDVGDTTHSEGEVGIRRRTSTISLMQNSERTGTTADEDRVAGHFTPCDVDIAKIRPIILQSSNNGQHQPERSKANVDDMASQMEKQTLLVEQLIAKIDMLDRSNNNK